MRSVVRLVLTTVVVALVSSPGSGQVGRLPDGAERAYTAVKDRVDGNAAMDVVRFMDQYWRISGNPGFNASVDRIRDSLQAAGVSNRVEEFTPRQGSGQAARGRGWDYQTGTVSFADTGEVLLSRERDRVSLERTYLHRDGSAVRPLALA